jgi:outer membrane protein TolC
MPSDPKNNLIMCNTPEISANCRKRAHQIQLIRKLYIRILSLIVIVFLFPQILASQETLSLQECFEKTLQNHPSGLQKEHLEKVNQLNQAVISTARLPQLGLNGMATYQSDVTQIDIAIPGMDFPGPSHDQYRMTLEARQLIYDGGTAKYRQALRESTHAADIQEIEVQLYQLLEQVNRHYFQQFILEENLNILDLNLSEINQRISTISSAIANGILLPSSKWVLEAEILKLEQARTDLLLTIKSNREILEILTGESLENKILNLPSGLQINNKKGVNRPELKLFALQKKKVSSASQLTSTANMPKVSSFVQAGYGKPGLNMLSDQFNFYYMAGISLSWNLWDWQKNHKERQVQHINADMISTRQQVFEQNISIAGNTIITRISQLEEAMKKDEQIIQLHEMIVESAGSQLQNGVINSTEYLHQLNALAKARIEHQTHKIRWIQAIAEYNILTGNF